MHKSDESTKSDNVCHSDVSKNISGKQLKQGKRSHMYFYLNIHVWVTVIY